jgi:SAM-dependent methyltransferase
MQFMWQMAKTTADLILLEILRRELLLGSIQNLQEAVMLGVGLTLLFVSQAVNLGSEAYGVSQAKLPSMFSALRRLFRQKAPGGGQSPRRLVAGGGHADFMPGLQPDDISLNNDMDLRGPTLPDVKGDINAMPFRGGSFDDVCFERIQYEAFTGGNVGSLSEAARVLKPGGGLRIVTGANAPVKEIISALKELGFSVEKMQLGDSLEIVATLVK